MSETPKSKLIIDEDWKAQAQAEKEALAAAEQVADSGSAGATGSTADSSAGGAEPTAALGQLPPPSLATLVTSLATQAIVALGQVPDPLTGQADFQPQLARHFIDTLGMLEQKTAGNRTPEEEQLFSNLLHELRLIYVAATSAPPQTTGSSAAAGLDSL